MMNKISWTKKKLGGKNGLVEIVNGSTPMTDNSSYWDGDILWATPTDIGKLTSIYISDTQRKITKLGLESCSTKMIPPNSVLMTSRAPVGNLAINTKPICTNQGFKSFILNEDIDPYYLFFYLKHKVPQIIKDSHGNTFTEINKTQIEKFEVFLPPTKIDQINIANEIKKKLDSVEQMRQAALNQKEAVECLQGALLREVFLFKKGDKLPDGWRWEKIGNLFEEEKIQIQPNDKSFKELQFIGLENINSNTREFILGDNISVESTCYRFKETNILYGKLRPYLNKLYLPVNEGKSSMELIPLKAKGGYSREFIAAVLQSEAVLGDTIKFSTGGRMPRADIAKLKKLNIAIPEDIQRCLNIGIAVQSKIKDLIKLGKEADQQLEAIEALPAAILREVFEFKS